MTHATRQMHITMLKVAGRAIFWGTALRVDLHEKSPTTVPREVNAMIYELLERYGRELR